MLPSPGNQCETQETHGRQEPPPKPPPWKAEKRRAQLIRIPNQKMFVLGFARERRFNMPCYDVTYEHLEHYDLAEITRRFRQRSDGEFAMFSFIGCANDGVLRTLSQTRKIEVQLPDHLMDDWQRVMGENTRPHFSYFCIPASELARLERKEDMHARWQRLCPELRHMFDERNMILWDLQLRIAPGV